MWINKNQRNYLCFSLFKILCLILGLNIFLTSFLTLIKLEFKKNNTEAEMNLNINKLRY